MKQVRLWRIMVQPVDNDNEYEMSPISNTGNVVRVVDVVQAPWYKNLGFGKLYELKLNVGSEVITTTFRAYNQGFFGKLIEALFGRKISNVKDTLIKELQKKGVNVDKLDMKSLFGTWHETKELEKQKINEEIKVNEDDMKLLCRQFS